MLKDLDAKLLKMRTDFDANFKMRTFFDAQLYKMWKFFDAELLKMRIYFSHQSCAHFKKAVPNLVTPSL